MSISPPASLDNLPDHSKEELEFCKGEDLLGEDNSLSDQSDTESSDNNQYSSESLPSSRLPSSLSSSSATSSSASPTHHLSTSADSLGEEERCVVFTASGYQCGDVHLLQTKPPIEHSPGQVELQAPLVHLKNEETQPARIVIRENVQVATHKLCSTGAGSTYLVNTPINRMSNPWEVHRFNPDNGSVPQMYDPTQFNKDPGLAHQDQTVNQQPEMNRVDSWNAAWDSQDTNGWYQNYSPQQQYPIQNDPQPQAYPKVNVTQQQAQQQQQHLNMCVSPQHLQQQQQQSYPSPGNQQQQPQDQHQQYSDTSKQQQLTPQQQQYPSTSNQQQQHQQYPTTPDQQVQPHRQQQYPNTLDQQQQPHQQEQYPITSDQQQQQQQQQQYPSISDQQLTPHQQQQYPNTSDQQQQPHQQQQYPNTSDQQLQPHQQQQYPNTSDQQQQQQYPNTSEQQQQQHYPNTSDQQQQQYPNTSDQQLQPQQQQHTKQNDSLQQEYPNQSESELHCSNQNLSQQYQYPNQINSPQQLQQHQQPQYNMDVHQQNIDSHTGNQPNKPYDAQQQNSYDYDRNHQWSNSSSYGQQWNPQSPYVQNDETIQNQEVIAADDGGGGTMSGFFSGDDSIGTSELHSANPGVMEDIPLDDTSGGQSTGAAATGECQTYTSNSASKLTPEQSGSDQLGAAELADQVGVDWPRQDQELLNTAPESQGHSRESSYGNNVHFIVGSSEPASASHSHTASPMPEQYRNSAAQQSTQQAVPPKSLDPSSGNPVEQFPHGLDASGDNMPQQSLCAQQDIPQVFAQQSFDPNSSWNFNKMRQNQHLQGAENPAVLDSGNQVTAPSKQSERSSTTPAVDVGAAADQGWPSWDGSTSDMSLSHSVGSSQVGSSAGLAMPNSEQHIQGSDDSPRTSLRSASRQSVQSTHSTQDGSIGNQSMSQASHHSSQGLEGYGGMISHPPPSESWVPPSPALTPPRHIMENASVPTLTTGQQYVQHDRQPRLPEGPPSQPSTVDPAPTLGLQMTFSAHSSPRTDSISAIEPTSSPMSQTASHEQSVLPQSLQTSHPGQGEPPQGLQPSPPVQQGFPVYGTHNPNQQAHPQQWQQLQQGTYQAQHTTPVQNSAVAQPETPQSQPVAPMEQKPGSTQIPQMAAPAGHSDPVQSASSQTQQVTQHSSLPRSCEGMGRSGIDNLTMLPPVGCQHTAVGQTEQTTPEDAQPAAMVSRPGEGLIGGHAGSEEQPAPTCMDGPRHPQDVSHQPQPAPSAGTKLEGNQVPLSHTGVDHSLQKSPSVDQSKIDTAVGPQSPQQPTVTPQRNVAYKNRGSEREQTMSPAATLWENPVPDKNVMLAPPTIASPVPSNVNMDTASQVKSNEVPPVGTTAPGHSNLKQHPELVTQVQSSQGNSMDASSTGPPSGSAQNPSGEIQYSNMPKSQLQTALGGTNQSIEAHNSGGISGNPHSLAQQNPQQHVAPFGAMNPGQHVVPSSGVSQVPHDRSLPNNPDSSENLQPAYAAQTHGQVNSPGQTIPKSPSQSQMQVSNPVQSHSHLPGQNYPGNTGQPQLGGHLYDRGDGNVSQVSDMSISQTQQSSGKLVDTKNDRLGQSRDSKYGYPERKHDRYGRDYDRYYDRPSSRASRDEYEHYYDRSRSFRGYPEDRPRSRQGYPDDRPRSRQGYPDDRPRSRQGYPDDRPQSRQGYPEGRPRSRQGYPDEPYERPRSRQGFDYPERPRSRQGLEEGHGSRPSSRQGYPDGQSLADPSPRSYDDRYRGTDPYARDPYYRSRYYQDYYDRVYYDRGHDYYDRDGYYNYGELSRYDDRYSRGYYEELKSYGHGEYTSYGNYDEYDQRSHHSSMSRGSTPGLESGADHFAREFHQGSRPGSRQSGYEPSPIRTEQSQDYYGYNRSQDPYGQSYHQYPYDQSHPAGYPQQAPEPSDPVKFSIPHLCVRFSAGGQLIQVQPTRPQDGQPARVLISEMQGILTASEEQEQLRLFPGPLVKGDTHKNDVLLFCQKKAKECWDNVNLMDRESADLLWKYLQLLIKQNGTLIGTDVADLLLEGHEPSGVEFTQTGMSISVSATDSAARPEVAPEPTERVDRSLVSQMKDLSLHDITDRFRHLLLHGRKKDALEWAIKNELWGHALFLASKMDPKTHASIMTRFANVSMKINDPLQTLYQLMSGRQPAAVTLVADEKWGDWRPHMAMILANQTSRADLDKKSIVTLADTLASKGYLFASHFCYLMAKHPFGTFAKKTSKIVLIGSCHTQALELFATSLAIQCTEVFEYAMSLGNPTFCLPTFQPYKLLYAYRLAELGMPEEALHYAEVIGSLIQQSPTLYQVHFVKQVYELGSRLKYYDPQRLQTGEMEDPVWLTNLARIIQMFEEGTIQTVAANQTTLGFGIPGTASSSEADHNSYQQHGDPNVSQAYQEYWHQQGQQYAGYQQNQYPQQAMSGQQEQVNASLQQQQQQPGQFEGQDQDSVNQWQQAQYQWDGSYTQFTAEQQAQLTDQAQHGQPQLPTMEQQQNQQQQYPQHQHEQQQMQQQFQGDQPEQTVDKLNEVKDEVDYTQTFDRTHHPSGGSQASYGRTRTTSTSSYGKRSRQPSGDVNLAGSMNSNYSSRTRTSSGTMTDPEDQMTASGSVTPQRRPSIDYYGQSVGMVSAVQDQVSTSHPPTSMATAGGATYSTSLSPAAPPKSLNVSHNLTGVKMPENSEAKSPDPAASKLHFHILNIKFKVSPANLLPNKTITSSKTQLGGPEGGSIRHVAKVFKLKTPTKASVELLKARRKKQAEQGLPFPESPDSQSSLSPQTPDTIVPSQPTPTAESPSKTQEDVFKFGVPPPPNYRAAPSTAPLGLGKRGSVTEQKSSATGSVHPTTAPFTAPPAGSKIESKVSKSANQSSGGSSWIGGLFKKFVPKGKNEMKLPDDKNPTIVWDAEQRRWVNTDAEDEAASAPAPPPPMDKDLKGPSTVSQMPSTPGSSSGMPPPATPGTNRFSRQKTRGARGQYVDVLAGSGIKSTVSAPSNLFNVMPTSTTSMPANIFVPPVADSSDDANANNMQNQQQQQQQQQQEQQQYYNPNQYGGSTQHDADTNGNSETNLSRSSSMSSLSQEVQHYMQGPVSEPAQPIPEQSAVAPPAGMPMMFNPAQFEQPAMVPASSAARTGGMKYGQRRAYPK